MKILPKTTEEAIKLIWDIFNQGDSRYNAPENEYILADFLINEAISLEEEEIPNIKAPSNKEIFKLWIQPYAKYVMKQILLQEGFQDNEIFFERRFRGSQADVFAEKENKIILGECYSCRIDKIIDYLIEADEVWVITRGEDPWETMHYLKEKMRLFVFKKAKNWNNRISLLKKKQLEQLKKAKSPLDNL